jgi:hypothetical protein
LSNPNYDDALLKIGFPDQPSDWKKIPAVFSEGKLSIAGHPVMEDWEDSYMQELAHIATSNGGVILELGFGLGLSANYIQQQPIDKHIIIEANEDVFVKLEEFAKSAAHEVEPRFGLWEEVVPSIPDESIDGILFDTYPLSEEQPECEIPFFEHAYYSRKGVYLLITHLKFLIFHLSIFNYYRRQDLAISRKKCVQSILQMIVYTGKAKL